MYFHAEHRKHSTCHTHQPYGVVYIYIRLVFDDFGTMSLFCRFLKRTSVQYAAAAADADAATAATKAAVPIVWRVSLLSNILML